MPRPLPTDYFVAPAWHTNLDTYERIIEDDAKKSAIIIASAVYHLAMKDTLLPRYTKEQMPPLPPPRGEGGRPATPATTTTPARQSNR